MHLVAGLREIRMIAIAALSVTGTKKFFCKNVFHTKATPFIGQNHFWTGFCQRGHD